MGAQLLPGGHGYVLEDHGLFSTQDSGASWTGITPPGVSPTALNGFAFLPDGHGWAVSSTVAAGASSLTGRITIFRRDSSSNSWASSTIDSVPLANWFGQASVSFIDPQHGWLLIDTGSHAGFNYADLYRTADGGATWTALTAPASGGIEFVSGEDGFIAGGEMGPKLYVTHDGGSSWEPVPLPLPADRAKDIVEALGVPSGASDGLVVAVALDTAGGEPDGFGAYVSADPGTTWKLLNPLPDPAPSSSYLWGGQSGPQQLILRYGSGPLAYARSGDGGRTFGGFTSTVGLPLVPMALSSAGANTAWAVVQMAGCQEIKSDCFQSSGLFGSADGGASWRQLRVP